MIEIDSTRNNHLIDPALHVWGWEIPVYLFLGGMAAGLMIISAIIGRRIPQERQTRAMRLLPLAAPIIMSIGMGALFLDLENKLNVFRFYLAFRPTSPMSWGAWILVAIYPVTLMLAIARASESEIAFLTRYRLGSRVVEHARSCVRRLENASLVLGVALGAYTGILLATLGARALWNSLLLAPLFLASGVSAGIAAAMLLPISHDEHSLLRRWDIAVIVAEIVVLAMLLADLAGSGARGRAAAAMFFGGGFTAAFWSLVVVAGLLMPLLLETLEQRRHLVPTSLAPALLLAGGLALRWIFVAAGQVRV